jgi:hypothetical protein
MQPSLTRFIKSFHSCTLFYEFRAPNFKVHNLAKHALSLKIGRYLWLNDPYYVLLNFYKRFNESTKLGSFPQ